jgi:hypothetical protein
MSDHGDGKPLPGYIPEFSAHCGIVTGRVRFFDTARTA